ncbi:FAD-dependent oxidoreductase [Levilactobacillus zymae]|uniref:FAD-dependent oxidoreductase n=1 Tax=Levilactobacillus zymae TaxID=267363 RepID=UPI0028B5B2D5|nr:FAD-dependent oxidoreductase [Levilactobacillus zymae]MDT6981104.1 FAD-dependent oxidoreductase [Levilactobacillus zymae]
MGKKIVIVGGMAGGASVAARIRRLDETAQITIYERDAYVSISSCALPYYLSRTVPNADELVLMTPEQFKAQYNIDVVVNHAVTAIDPVAQTVQVTDQRTHEVSTAAYDELFLATGATPLRPASLTGSDGEQVFALRNVADVTALDTYLRTHRVTDVAVIGGGAIGVEATENLTRAGYRVTIIEQRQQVLSATVDSDLAQLVHKQLYDQHVDLRLGKTAQRITDRTVDLTDGTQVTAQAVLLALGVQPNTTLARAAGVELGTTGAIRVDQHYQTNLPHVYAVGDAIEVTNALTRQPLRLSLALPAQMEARRAVDHLYGRPIRRHGVLGSQGLPVFDLRVAATGLTEHAADAAQVAYRSALVIPSDKVDLMPNAHDLYLKVLFAPVTGEILGAQAIGQSEVDRQINVVATLMQQHATVEDLADLELVYQPTVSPVKTAVVMAGLVATNLLNDEYPQVDVRQVRQLVKAGATIIDVREPGEYAAGHLKGAKNIPMSQFRDRLAEIPRDRPVYLHCATAKRSYNVTRALRNRGYTNVVNIAGSFNAICETEFFHDQTTTREPIVTAYHFDL